MRLDKYLADLHIGSRSEVKEKIRQGLVKVNGQVVKDPGSAVSAAGAQSFPTASIFIICSISPQGF